MKLIAIADVDSLVGHLAVTGQLLVSLGDLFDNSIPRAVKRYEWGRVFGNAESA